MAKYDNLASINLELLDGNLAASPAITGPVALVIATALSGTSNTPFIVDDFNKAAALFGASSPLIKTANELKLGGAQNIAIYRIGGVSASIQGLFGDLSEITSVEESLGIGTKYSIYIGPQPNNPGEACLIIFEGAKIVYSTVPGSEVDLGRFVVVGFDTAFTGRIGTPSAPVALGLALAGLKNDTTSAFTGVSSQAAFDLPGTTDEGTLITSVKINTVLQAPSTYNFSEGGGTGGADAILFTNAPTAGATIEVIFSRPATVVGATYRTSADNMNAPYKKLYELVDAALLDLETTTATHIIIPEAIHDTPNIADGSVASNRLEYVRTTEVDGELTWNWSTVKTVYVPKTQTVTFTNVAAGLTEFALPGAADVNATVLTVTSNGAPLALTTGYTFSATTDVVTLAAATVLDDDIVITFKKPSIVSYATLDDNGQPIVDLRYNETNFTHRFGMFLDDLAANDKFVFGAIGTSQPIAATKAAVNAWLGQLPVKDITGEITANGTGLLGNRFMSGSTSQVNGFYRTDTGYVDGSIQYDTGGAPIDLGKFLSVVSAVVTTPRSPLLGLTARSVNAAAIYLGILTNVQPGDSTTNRTIPGVSLPFLLKKTKVNEIAGAGYVAFLDKGTSVACASGELPTGPFSDYDYVSTSITVADVTNRIRARLDPFLGKGLGPVQLAAMQTIVDAEFLVSVTAGAILKYSAQVVLQSVINGKGRVRIPYVVVPAFELREVNQSLVLAYDI